VRCEKTLQEFNLSFIPQNKKGFCGGLGGSVESGESGHSSGESGHSSGESGGCSNSGSNTRNGVES
jgi:hypothetical protein